ncbi:hypothetical protein A3C23_05810 [Candidatus Roizmanbacteria bacterium RIFCSPHIGHO2_02_FULL_37_13b]|uniref:Acetylornithine aminotransferase n=1 Tax=Candidatus Roizmanbacteria bacterium RIFCSPLOWO2_02_FULL_36_11 TaxID=1802071 RepID=A0A1F7JFP6_9BACT|nr:MAG: hypothetical protein A3C23_05810 [Candidatus Roizmanbacteria bacterium RIFCSPHIGHO2_02_FULL_37_13b]OGK54441.1 MAG: hypothetical protein A3H78_06075 [Candidatus Roizmanbacteria bacterium RIFCSPLOWO2_02_FULL_36_11]
MKNYLFLEKQVLLPLYPQRGLVLVRGQGVHLYDINNKEYLDMMSNYGVNIFGHTNQFILNAISYQLKKITNLHGSFTSSMRVEAADRLIKMCKLPEYQIYFSNSGTEAMEAALKFAVLTTGKKKFIVMKNNYHGKTLGALSTMVGSKYQKPFLPLLWDMVETEFGDIKDLTKKISSEFAAVVLEPIQGEGGIHVPSGDYLRDVQRLCQSCNVLMIVDEIQTGAGRTGEFLCSSYSRIEPDIIALGKGIGGGLPVGVTLVSRQVSQKIIRGIHSSTFGGNPLTCAGICASLEYMIENDIFSHVKKIGDYFINQLMSIKSPHIKQVRGKGLMIGVELDQPVTPVLKFMQDNGILVIPGGDMVVRFLPPYIIEKKHVDKTINVFNKALKSLIVTSNIKSA